MLPCETVVMVPPVAAMFVASLLPRLCAVWRARTNNMVLGKSRDEREEAR